MNVTDVLRASGWRMGHWEQGTMGCTGQEFWQHERYGLVRHAFDVAVADELQACARSLTEATALLARIVKYAREDRATTPGVTRLARVLAEVELDFLHKIDRAPVQPDAPTPEPRRLTDAEETALFPDGDPDPFEQPAAPEPSADPEFEADCLEAAMRNGKTLSRELNRVRDVLGNRIADLQREVTSQEQLTIRQTRRAESAEDQLAATQRTSGQRKDAWLAACAKLESARDALRLARATGCVPALVCAQLDACLQPDATPLADAESQLAAVRDIVRKSCISDARADDAGRLARAIRALLTAPSPGAGEKP